MTTHTTGAAELLEIRRLEQEFLRQRAAYLHAQSNVALLTDILNRRPPENSGLAKAYGPWSAEVYDLIGAMSAVPANDAQVEALSAAHPRPSPAPVHPPRRSQMTTPTDADIRSVWEQYNPLHGIESFARAVLAKWGAPPAQAGAVPLTVSQIREWWASENGLEDCEMCKITDFLRVVRAVEEKHGIKGGQHGL